VESPSFNRKPKARVSFNRKSKARASLVIQTTTPAHAFGLRLNDDSPAFGSAPPFTQGDIMRKPRWSFWALVALAATAAAGCGGSGLESVSGKVLLGDEPLTKGNVSFHRVGGGAMGTAVIQSDGSFTVKTGAQGGLAPGDYLIAVEARGPMPASTKEDPEPIPPLITPQKYANPKTSGFKCTVPLKEPLVLKLQPQ